MDDYAFIFAYALQIRRLGEIRDPLDFDPVQGLDLDRGFWPWAVFCRGLLLLSQKFFYQGQRFFIRYSMGLDAVILLKLDQG